MATIRGSHERHGERRAIGRAVRGIPSDSSTLVGERKVARASCGAGANEAVEREMAHHLVEQPATQPEGDARESGVVGRISQVCARETFLGGGCEEMPMTAKQMAARSIESEIVAADSARVLIPLYLVEAVARFEAA